MHSVIDFARKHDEMPAFHAMYLVLAILAAALLNLGMFGLLILAHMSLDMVKYRDFLGMSWSKTFKGMFQESLDDLALLGIGLVFSVYLHHSATVTTLSGLMHVELSAIRFLGTFIPKITILEHFMEVIVHIHRYLKHPHPNLEKGWSVRDIVAMVTIVLCVALLLIAAPLMRTDPSVIRWILFWELVPWNV